MTLEEFNYDKLVAPPIGYYFSQYDIQRLYEIATSLRYSAKPQVKYQEIDKIMKSRGFVKLSAGTNRIVYRCLENDTFVAKVAYDAVAITDNPREFANQSYLKPFCAKTFEVTQNGVLAFAERVDPITCREEFLSVAESIFTLITEFIIGEYVMDDIGTKYFMNYGMRRGFGPVILDYTFLYKLDGNKLFCNKPDNNKPEGKCLGEIDYDPGYNYLICKRCGKIYRAKDLELKVKENNIISKSVKGEFNQMKVKLAGGTKNYDVTNIVETTIVEDAKKEPQETIAYTDKKKSIHVSLGQKKEEAPAALKAKVVVPEVAVKPVEEKIEVKEEVKSEPAVVEEVHELKSPIKMGGAEKTTEEIIRDTFLSAGKFISEVNINNTIAEDHVNAAINGVKFIVDTLRMTSIWNPNFEKKLLDIILNYENLTLEGKIEIGEKEINSWTYFNAVVNEKTEEILAFNTVEYIKEEDVPEEEIPEEVEPANEDHVDAITEDTTQEFESYEGFEAYDIDDDQAYDEEVKLTGVERFKAKVIDVATKIPTLESQNVIVVEYGDGSLLTVNDGSQLFVIDNINDIDVNDASIVSKSFVESILKETEDKATELTKDALKAEAAEVTSSTVNGVPEEG